MTGAITFDFHNTLVRCDHWFELEVRTLPVVVLKELDGSVGQVDTADLTDAYRELRLDIIAHGRELDAVSGVYEAFRRIGVSVSPSIIGPIIDCAMLKAVDKAELMPGVRGTLLYLASSGARLGVVSSAVHHKFLEWALSRLGIADTFSAIVSSALTGFYKSRPEIYDCALAALGATAGQSVHVGDSYRFDHLTGKEAGLATVWLNPPSNIRPPDGAKPDLELVSLEGAGPSLLTLLDRRQRDARAN